MKVVKYKDALGNEYNVPEDKLEGFERRRCRLLRIAIAGQVLLLGVILYFSWRVFK